MEFYPPSAPVPEGLRGEEFVLRPLRATDNALDYAAVMATAETLRLRGSGEWPRPGFTPEENLTDLEGHETDFQTRRGFTYTVLDPTETICLGCVYLYPLDEIVRRVGGGEDDVARIGDHEAAWWFWVRPECVAADLDRRLLAMLLGWLRDDFAFAHVVFTATAANERELAIFEDAGLRLVWSHPVRDTRALHFA